MYHITDYTYTRAKNLGVQVKPSTRKNKKLDVFKDGKKIASIGDVRYGDYPTFVGKYGADYAYQRRIQYKIRHDKDRRKQWSNGWLADQLLW